MQSRLDTQVAIGDKIKSNSFISNAINAGWQIVDPFLNDSLNTTSWQLFSKLYHCGKNFLILAMQTEIDLQAGVRSRICPNRWSTKQEIKFEKFVNFKMFLPLVTRWLLALLLVLHNNNSCLKGKIYYIDDCKQ